MRYFRGAIALSPTQDLPLLRQVMYSKFVTQTQLWQFMRHSGNELSRGSFWWRVKRLADNGFITHRPGLCTSSRILAHPTAVRRMGRKCAGVV